jgi:DNA-binding PadR family transcriptional regulator
MSIFARPGSALRHAQKRGAARLLILKVLSSRSMHGYDISNEISSMFGGRYRPSPGVVYPTLQSLEDEGSIVGRREESKTVYTITPAGRALLDKRSEVLGEIMELARGSTSGDVLPLRKSASRLERTILLSLPEMSHEKRVRVSRILDSANEQIARLMSSN